jgi:putative PEP-CTERM system histidine kinase
LNPEQILLLIAGLWALGLGVGALFRKPRTLAVWSFGLGMAVLAADGLLALQVSRTDVLETAVRLESARYVLGAMLPALWLTFSICYSRGNSIRFLKAWKPVLIASCLLPLLPLIGWGHLFWVDSNAWQPGTALELRWLARTVHLVVLISAVLVLMNLERTFAAAVGTLRWRIKFAIMGLGLIFAARVYTSSQVLLYSVSNSSLPIFNAGALLLGCVLISVSFVRAGLAAVEVYPSLAVLEKSVTVLLAGVYLLVIGVLAKLIAFLGGDTAFPVKALFVLVALIGLGLLLASDRARFIVRRFVSRHFRRPFYDYRALWRTFSDRTSSIVDEAKYARELANLISDSVQSLSVSVWLEQPGRRKMMLAASTSLGTSEPGGVHPAPTEISMEEFSRHVASNPEPFALEDSREKWIEELKRGNPDIFGKGGKRVCVPLIGKGQPLGMLIIGDRVNGIPFSVEDFELFKSLGAQAASGLLNLQLTQQLIQARELEAFQAMSAFFVHDLKNTASTLSLMLQNLPAHFDDPAFREDALRAISKSVGRINDLIARMTLLRQRLELRLVESDLSEVVADALNSLKGAISTNVVRSLAPVPKVPLDPGQIQKVVVNLLLNAHDAAGNTGEIRVETAAQNGWAMLSVSDNGIGMSQEFITRSLFRPFQTTKKKGVGIGLFHSKMIVDAHHGRIEVESGEGKGTVFRVLLPMGTNR